MSSAFVVVDVQQGMFTLPQPLYRGDELLRRVAGLLARARNDRCPVIHIRHDAGPGHPLAKGSTGWLHHPMVAPRDDELIIDKNRSSAFHHTDLRARLSEMGVGRLIIAGVQTEMCVESICRAAVGLDYDVTIVSDAHTTYDTPILSAEQIIAHHNRIWGRGFAHTTTTDEVRF